MADDKFVWVIETHEGHGEGADVMGVYASEESARRALEAAPNMRVHVEPDMPGFTGGLMGEPIDEHAYPHIWAFASRYPVVP